MKIVSFGGFVHNEAVPAGKVRNTQSGIIATQILEAMEKLPAGSALPIEVSEFGPYERYALQNRLQARGAKVVVRVDVNSKRDEKTHVITKGTIYVMKMTDAQWKEYNAQPGNAPKKK